MEGDAELGPAAGDPRMPSEIARAFALPDIAVGVAPPVTRDQGSPPAQTAPPTPHPPAPPAAAVSDECKPDPFTAWVSGAPVDDGILNVWRALVYDAVSAAIDWDTEPGLAPLSGLFMARYIHFEGQFVRALPNPVELRIARSTAAGLALRTLQLLRSETVPANPADAEEALADLWPWVREQAAEVLRQLGPPTRRSRRIVARRGAPSGTLSTATPRASGRGCWMHWPVPRGPRRGPASSIRPRSCRR